MKQQLLKTYLFILRPFLLGIKLKPSFVIFKDTRGRAEEKTSSGSFDEEPASVEQSMTSFIKIIIIRIIPVLFLLVWGISVYSQTNFLISCTAELKMSGIQKHNFYSYKSYLLYSANASYLKIVINMYDLKDKHNRPLKGQEITFNNNIADTNNLIFEGSIPENKIRPDGIIKDTYTFTITGTVKFRDFTYTTQIVCSYGAKMIRNQSQVSLNINLEINKMDYPMYIPAIKEIIDNLKIEISDGTVNMVEN